VELRPEQIADNRAQAEALFGGALDFGREVEPPRWLEGDATRMHEHDLPFADLVFTCPPYADLEVYSDDPRDLSTMKVRASSARRYSRVCWPTARRCSSPTGSRCGWSARPRQEGVEAGFVSDTVVGSAVLRVSTSTTRPC
jgi:hypothetical protein